MALPYTFCLQVPYSSATSATYVANALSVDPELTPDKVTKNVRVDGSTLLADFSASELRVLRASLSAFMDMLALSNRTLEAFGNEASA